MVVNLQLLSLALSLIVMMMISLIASFTISLLVLSLMLSYKASLIISVFVSVLVSVMVLVLMIVPLILTVRLVTICCVKPGKDNQNSAKNILDCMSACRTGQGTCDIIKTIIDEVIDAGKFQQELDKVIFLDNASRIFVFLRHTRPLYFHNDSTVQCIPGASSSSVLYDLSTLLESFTLDVPPLKCLCVDSVRNAVALNQVERGSSILPEIKKLKSLLPPSLISDLCLDNLFYNATRDLCRIRCDEEDEDGSPWHDISLGFSEHTNYCCSHAISPGIVGGAPEVADFEINAPNDSNQLLEELTPSRKSVQHIRNVFDFPDTPFPVLESLFPLCNTCLVDSKVAMNVTNNFGEMIEALSVSIDVSKCDTHNIQSKVNKFVSVVISLVYTSGRYCAVPCGSSSTGVKISEWNEFDFLIQVTYDVDFENKTNEFTGDPKDFLYHQLDQLLAGLRKPDNPHTGVPYIESCYPHSRAPGVCVKLAWWCLHDHKHVISIDMTPAFLSRKKIKDSLRPALQRQQWCDLAEMESILVQSQPCRPREWQTTYNTCDKEVYKQLDAISPNIKHVVRTLKLIRDMVFMKVLRHSSTALPPGDVYRGRQSELISSYTLQQLVWWEVESFPLTSDWDGSKLHLRLVSILEKLRDRNEMRSYYTGERQGLLCVPPNQRALLKPWLDRDINMAMRCIRECVGDEEMVSDDIEQAEDDFVYLVLHSGMKVAEINKIELMADPQRFRSTYVLGEYTNMYFYAGPSRISEQAVTYSLISRIMCQFQQNSSIR